MWRCWLFGHKTWESKYGGYMVEAYPRMFFKHCVRCLKAVPEEPQERRVRDGGTQDAIDRCRLN